MARLVKHYVRSEDEVEIRQIAEAVFRPCEFNRLMDDAPFDMSAHITSVEKVTLWRSHSRSGYRARYGCPKHHQVELHFIEEGSYRFHTQGHDIEAPVGSAVLLKDTRKVEIAASPGARKLAMVIPYDKLAPHIQRGQGSAGTGLAGFRSHIRTDVTGIETLHRIATHLMDEVNPPDPASDVEGAPSLIGDALIMMFVGLWPRGEAAESDRKEALPRHLERAIDWLQRHADEEISIERLARLAGASVRTLQNSFRLHLSTTPNAYALQVRLARAHEDLMHGPANDSIEAIASRWGFGHMGYFAARYRAAYGRSPSETRRQRPDVTRD